MIWCDQEYAIYLTTIYNILFRPIFLGYLIYSQISHISKLAKFIESFGWMGLTGIQIFPTEHCLLMTQYLFLREVFCWHFSKPNKGLNIKNIRLGAPRPLLCQRCRIKLEQEFYGVILIIYENIESSGRLCRCSP